MYRYSNGQISLADFKQPVGMNLKESNRWVKKSQTIPWLEIETRYAALFIGVLSNGMTLLSAPYYITDITKGLVILLAVTVTSIQRNKKK